MNSEEREAVLRKIKSSAAHVTHELGFRRKDGTEIIVSDTKVAVRDKHGKVLYLDGILEDITESRQAEEKARQLETLKELDRLRNELLANVSHELRTPLTSIKGFASTLLRTDTKWSEEEQRDFLETIDQEADRLTSLISDLLDMSSIEARALKLERKRHQVAEIIDSVSGSLTSLARDHQLKVEVPSALPLVFADRARIGQVLTNLVDNAAKFSPEGSPIIVEAELVKDHVVVSIVDRGEGIPNWLIDKVFDRFYQAETIAKGRKSGTGLGLSICRGIVQAHGGEIWVESKMEKGSRFSFSLPLSEGQDVQDSGH